MHAMLYYGCVHMTCQYSLSRHAMPRCTMHYVVLLFTLSIVTIFAARLVKYLFIASALCIILYTLYLVME
jgi:hypothetical protein